MSLHPFYKVVYGFSALHALWIGALIALVLPGLLDGDAHAIVPYQQCLLFVWAGLRAVANNVIENTLVKHSAVFRSLSAHDQRSLVTSVNQFTSLISWSCAGGMVAIYAPFHSHESNQQLLHPLGQWFTHAAIVDFAADLYRNPDWDVYIHHAFGLMMMVVSFETLPISLSDPGVIIYAMQNGLDRCVRLLLFWSKMRRQQVALLEQDGEVQDKETAKGGVSLDRLIPNDASLRHQFTIGIVVYTFGIRTVMYIACGIYAWSAWDEMVWGWRLAHLAFPVVFVLTDIKFWKHLYRKSSFAKPKGTRP